MIKKINKKALSLIMAGVTLITIPTFTSCVKKKENGIYIIGSETNEFDKYKKTIIRNGKPVTAYLSKNVSIAFDKNDFTTKEYIYDTNAGYDIYPIGVIYDLKEEVKLFEFTIRNIIGSKDRLEYDKLIENNYFVDLIDLKNYVEDIELKEYYTLEEIKELEPKILESLKLIVDYEQKQKVKK